MSSLPHFSDRGLATRAIHAVQPPEPTTGAIMTPIFQTSTYVQSSPGELKDGYDYARTKNPTRTALEVNFASLEGGKHGLCFATGCASVATMLHLFKSGDHVLLCDDVYGGTFRLFDKVFKQMGLEYSLVDMTDLKATEAAVRPTTRLIWIETPTNPMLKVIDIAAVAAIGKKRGVLVGVDNTFASSYLQTPLSLGADITCHSSTKYLGGHSDVLGGLLVVNDDALAEKLRFMQNAIGAVPAPLDCFLILRSTKTLQIRMERHCDNAKKVVEFLRSHSKIEQVIYPGLPSHPQHSIAKKQMKDFGGMVSVLLKGDLSTARSFLERVKVFSLAESLGGVESLIEHPAIMTHASIPAENRKKLGILDNFVRLSVGIEDADDLVDDLRAALG